MRTPNWERKRLKIYWAASNTGFLLDEYNYLLNPTHPDFAKIEMGKPIVYYFDPRLKKH